MIQLDFFQSPLESELFHIKKELERVEESGHKVRRGTYASINKLGKLINDQEQRITELEHKLYVMEKCLKELKNATI